MGENPFLGFLALLFFALLVSSGVFYHYVFVAGDADATSEIVQTRFDQRALEQITQTWQKREEKFNQAGKDQTRNIFVPSQKAKELTE